MRKIFDRLFALLGAIGKDKYQHFSLGAIIAVVALCLSAGLPFPAANFVSIVAVLGVELFKEFVLDAKADWRDVVATLLGGLCVWVGACVVFGVYCAY
jgi:short subunit fatty acids transporter